VDSVLLYRGSCARCRVLSRLAVLLTLGTLRRVPLDSDEADRLRQLYPVTRGKLALIDGRRVVHGARVVVEAPRWMLRGVARRVLSLGAARGPRRGS